MLRSLLEDRFQLKVHRETKEGVVFILTVAKGGLKIQPLQEGHCMGPDPARPPSPPAPGQMPTCGVIRPGGSALNRTMDAVGADMLGFTKTLTLILGRLVIDQTGLTRSLRFAASGVRPRRADGARNHRACERHRRSIDIHRLTATGWAETGSGQASNRSPRHRSRGNPQGKVELCSA
jgi:uncharacterized protein (TIGR03435 family)